MRHSCVMTENNSVLLSIDCLNGVPSVEKFFSSLKWIHKWILVLPVGFWFMTFLVFVVNIKRAIKREAKETKSNVLVLLSLYPVRFLKVEDTSGSWRK